MNFDFPEGPPGIHPITAALSRMLKLKGVDNPISEAPYTEAFLFGIGGGIDIGYILYQFSHLPHPMLVLGFRHNWNNTRAFLENTTKQLYFSAKFYEFSNQSDAQKKLQNILANGKPAIVWVDKATLPYHHMRQNLIGFVNHQVAVYARNGRNWRLFIDDLSSRPIEIREKVFTTARANLSQKNFLMMVFNRSRNIDASTLRDAILEGIGTCANQLTRPLKNSGISNLETWSNNMVDRSDRRGWQYVFKDAQGLFIVLRTIYESIKLNGTDGFALRKLYADFLHEAANYLNNPAINAITGQYLQISKQWANLAENALPSKIPNFDSVKKLLNKKYQAYRKHDMETYDKALKELYEAEENLSADFPLDSYQTNKLFERLSNQIQLISELEINAAQRLHDIIQL